MNFKNYQEFNDAKIKCNLCEIGKIYNKIVLSDGNSLNPKILIIGECPGASELVEGKPFVGKAGKLLRPTLEEAGITLDISLITNLMPCRPLDNKFPTDNNIINNCKNMWLKEEIRLTKPDLILLIGSKPLKFLLKLDKITQERGKIHTKICFGKKTKIMATYHPSFVLRKMYMQDGKQILDDFKNDIKKAKELIN